MTSSSSSRERARAVRSMFSGIAPHYDLMNRLMTGGMDAAWRRQVIRHAQLQPGSRLLDLGAGTGDLAREALHRQPDCQVVAADFTLEMMLVGKARRSPEPDWLAADALNVPLPDETFDAVVSGFLLRNITDLQRALQEQRRVLKPGGHMVCLDTTRPRDSLLSPFIHFHMHRVIPFLGSLLTGDRAAYTYLPQTSENFLSAEDLLDCIRQAGFSDAGFRRTNFGTVAIHWGTKGNG